MKSALITSLLVGAALSIFAAESANDWKLAKQANGVAIYSRPHPGSHLKEFKAIGEFDASTHTVHKVIDDVEAYPSFMPYTAEASVLKRNDDSLITYQRISPKIVSDRDYTLRIQKKSWPTQFGIAYLNEWKPANEHGPSEKPGVFRVKLVDGSWLLEPTGANKTRATYYVYTDSGIVVPPFLANTISETGITKLFAAVRKQAKEPKYQTK
ncbi:MAG TPA: SRPBCC family protein [Chthoniobacterales bacterium]|jgi:Polyketide cyclase / dehydrase and lipid transport|nr:SRPBCC family protein [Chthoniobacterales bacterium]